MGVDDSHLPLLRTSELVTPVLKDRCVEGFSYFRTAIKVFLCKLAINRKTRDYITKH
jgi:hypothetical protein